MTVNELPEMNAAFCEAKLSGCRATAIPKSISSITLLTIILFFTVCWDYWCRIQMRTFFFFNLIFFFFKAVSTGDITSCWDGALMSFHFPVIFIYFFIFSFWFSTLLSVSLSSRNVAGKQISRIFSGISSFSSFPPQFLCCPAEQFLGDGGTASLGSGKLERILIYRHFGETIRPKSIPSLAFLSLFNTGLFR